MQIQGVMVKKLFVAMSLLVFLITGPITIAEEHEIVQCCIKPCSCRGSSAGPPECKEISRSECKRLGGEVVQDCMLCN